MIVLFIQPFLVVSVLTALQITPTEIGPDTWQTIVGSLSAALAGVAGTLYKMTLDRYKAERQDRLYWQKICVELLRTMSAETAENKQLWEKLRHQNEKP